MKFFFSALYPSFCSQCGILAEYDAALCMACFQALPRLAPLVVSVGSGLTIKVHSVGDFSGLLSSLVQKKERRDILSAYQLGRIAAQYAQQALTAYDVIVAVPSHWSRFIRRGYNPAVIIAKSLAGCGLGRFAQLLRKVRFGPYQRGLSARRRLLNVKRAFGLSVWWPKEAVYTALAGKRVLLVDDVYTTGATVKECARFLLQFKPQELEVLTCCRVL